MHNIIKCAKASGLDLTLPPHAPHKEGFSYFHIKVL